MDLGVLGASAETHLNDLQADIEAGSRLIDRIHHRAADIRNTLADRRDRSAVTSLMKQVAELKACVLHQRERVRELRHDIRDIRDRVKGRPNRRR
jgi:predicted  nucleic acid-binding Zn-ribbon protein